MKIKKKLKTNKPFIVAEIGNNHEGSFLVAKKLIFEAHKAGVDAVKFQTFKTESYVNDMDSKRFKRLKKFELTQKEFIKLSKFAKKKKLKFISTPFDIESAVFLNNIVDYFKISSGDNNFNQLIAKVLSFKKPTFISVGILNFNEIKKLITFVTKQKFPLKKLTLLHCVSAYPANDSEANLNSIKFLKKKLKVRIGYSDHTIGAVAPIIASTYGANVIEKHFTLNKNYSNFRDHKISSDIHEMKFIVSETKRVSSMLGFKNKNPSFTEKNNAASMRRSLYARKDIKKNSIINYRDIKIVRPFVELGSNDLSKILKKKSKRNINKSEPITKNIIN